MPAASKTAQKAITRKAGAARAVRAVPADPNDVPDELRDFYSDGPAPGPNRATRRAAQRAGAVEESLDFTTEEADEVADVPMEKLFSINGKDYYIPVTFPPGVGLVYLHGVEEGRDVALGRCLKLVLGERSWNELQAFVMATKGGGITRGQMGQLLDKVLTKVMGALEDDGEKNG